MGDVSPPECYAQKVVNYSRLDVGDGYFAGIHYRRLGNFLISPYKTYGEDVEVSISDDQEFQSVTLCDLTRRWDDAARTTSFSRPVEFSDFLHKNQAHLRETELKASQNADLGPSSAPLSSKGPDIMDQTSTLEPSQSLHQSYVTSKHPGRMVFLRGFSSAEWLNCLGAALDVDPEFYHRHLAVPVGLQPKAPRTHYSYPTPFPESRDLIQLRVCNTGSWAIQGPNPTLDFLRKCCDDSLRDHLDDVANLGRLSAGDSIGRRFILHDLHNFSIEQKITIEVIHHTRTWAIVVWTDSGRGLGHSRKGPWLRDFPFLESIRLHPIFQHRPRMALSPVPKLRPSTLPRASDAVPEYPQSIHHLMENYGRHLKSEIMAFDAFYALSELFEFSAASIAQLLELFEDTLRVALRQLDGVWLSELLMLKAFLDDYRSYIKYILDIICRRGDARWPRVADPKQREKTDRAAVQLEHRYQRLLARCDRLSEHCSSGIALLMSLQAQRQADQAMAQADRLGKLSVLAYIYIPTTFAASFYGMNLRELGSQLSIWNFFVMAAGLLTISIVAWFINVRATVACCWKFMKRSLSPTNSGPNQRNWGVKTSGRH